MFGDDFVFAAGEDTGRCCSRAYEELWKQRSRFGMVFFDRLIVPMPLWEYFQGRSAGKQRFRMYLASPQMEKLHFVRLFHSHDAYMASLSPKTRQNLRRTTRKLCHEKQARLEKVTSPERVPWFLEQLDKVFQETWQAKTFGYQPRNTEEQRKYLTHSRRIRLAAIVHTGQSRRPDRL